MKSKLFGISLLTVTTLYGLLAAIILIVCLIAGIDVLIGIGISVAVLLIQFLISPILTDLSMKWFYHADWSYKVPEYLSNFISEECKKYNVNYPKIGFIDDGGPNAFTYGRTKKDARIVLTRGIFDLLSEEEVKAVVAHEMGHIVHMDMLVMTFAQLVPLILYGIYEMLVSTDKSDSDNNKLAVLGYVAYLFYLISQYIILWLSRTREYYADDFSVTETKNPNALAEALVKIGFGLSTNSTAGKHDVSKNNTLGIFDSKTSKSLVVSCSDSNMNVDKNKIKNAMKWEMWNPWALWFQLHSTHPLISKRLIAISKRSEEFNQTPYIVFDLEKPESYVDDFFLELFIKFLPVISIIVGIILLCFVDEKLYPIIIIACIFAIEFGWIWLFNRSHRNKNYKETNVSDLLSEVKVSNITSIPCILKGKVIGKGNPGYIFSEDFIIKDETGIIFLDYNQPLFIINKIFALFKSNQYIDKEITIKGWYRRSPVPYVEIKEMNIDGKVKKVFTYGLTKFFLYSLVVLTIAVIGFVLIA